MQSSSRILFTLFLGGVFAPSVAFAHAEVVSSVPAENGPLAAGAKEIALTFDEDVKPVSCKLADEAGKDAAMIGKPAAKGATLHVPLNGALPVGKYNLTCRVVGPDSHAVNGSLKFVVNAGASP